MKSVERPKCRVDERRVLGAKTVASPFTGHAMGWLPVPDPAPRSDELTDCAVPET